MLRSFRVANHKSIKAEQELLLMPAYAKERPAVPVAAVFGANASGKSNLLGALRWMCTAVRESYANWEPGTGLPRDPFLLDHAAAGESSLFVVALVLDGVRWTYGFTVDDRRVAGEWLYTYPHNRKRAVFERDGGAWSFGSGVPQAESGLLRGLTRDNALFLSVASRSDFEPTARVYGWFQRGVRFAQPASDGVVDAVARRLERASDLERDRFVDLVRAADLGIADLRVDHLAPSRTDQDIRDGRTDLLFLHSPSDAPLHIDEQSAGTVAWLSLLTSALSTLETGGLLCVDEIDTSLHPRLTARLIELFHDPGINRHDAQLIFTTHDATLLGTSFGDEILARDEVWFVEKDAQGRTTLYPLTDFHPRKDENTERRYLGGSYGAVPAVFSGTLADRYRGVEAVRAAS